MHSLLGAGTLLECKKPDTLKGRPVSLMVEVAGFEPAAFWSRTKRATKLRYTSVFGHPTAQGRVLATLGDCEQSLSLVGQARPTVFGHPTAQGRVLATLGDCEQSLSLVGQARPAVFGHPMAQGKKKTGADKGTRTPDLLITNQSLYRLSYIGITST